MNTKEALSIVMDLAYQNRIEDTMGDESLEEEQKRQDEAIMTMFMFSLTLAQQDV